VSPDTGEPEVVTSPPVLVGGKEEVDSPVRPVHVAVAVVEVLRPPDLPFEIVEECVQPIEQRVTIHI
jgi:hypothetical protein